MLELLFGLVVSLVLAGAGIFEVVQLRKRDRELTAAIAELRQVTAEIAAEEFRAYAPELYELARKTGLEGVEAGFKALAPKPRVLTDDRIRAERAVKAER